MYICDSPLWPICYCHWTIPPNPWAKWDFTLVRDVHSVVVEYLDVTIPLPLPVPLPLGVKSDFGQDTRQTSDRRILHDTVDGHDLTITWHLTLMKALIPAAVSNRLELQDWHNRARNDNYFNLVLWPCKHSFYHEMKYFDHQEWATPIADSHVHHLLHHVSANGLPAVGFTSE